MKWVSKPPASSSPHKALGDVQSSQVHGSPVGLKPMKGFRERSTMAGWAREILPAVRKALEGCRQHKDMGDTTMRG